MYGIDLGEIRALNQALSVMSDRDLESAIKVSYRKQGVRIWSCQIAIFVVLFGLAYYILEFFAVFHWLGHSVVLATLAFIYFYFAHRATLRLVVNGS